MRLILVCTAAVTLSGCRTAASIVTLPVRAVSEGVDAVTTSRAERDRAEGRRLRREDERRGREAREAERRERAETRRRRDGNDSQAPDDKPR